MNTHSKIGKVKPKFSIIEPGKRGQFRKTMHEHVDNICDTGDDEIAGYYLCAYYFDGTYNRGWRLDESAPFGTTMFLSACKETINRTVSELAAHDVKDGYI